MLGYIASKQIFDTSPAKALLSKHASLKYLYACSFGKARLEIDEGVFCPTLTNVSPFLLKSIDFRPGERVLDAFAGSGAFGINAAMYGATVTAFDISGRAIRCMQLNSILNGVAEQVEARQGTLSETILPTEVFELIIANPPLLPGIPGRGLDAALFDRD